VRILALNGSPIKNGNCDFLIDVVGAAIGRAAEFEKINIMETLQTAKWFPCTSCSSPCNGCCFKGTDVEKTFEKMKEADVIILASPVYFGTVSGILKCFWDKTRQLRSECALVGKKCAAITSGHTKFGGQETTIRALHDMALIQGMEIIADGAKEFDAGHHGVASSGNACQDELAIKRCKVLASRIMGS
jgi:multimeric flavodoxin WrbA